MLLLLALLAQSVENKLGFESFLPTSVVGALGTLVSIGLVVDRIKNRGKKEGVDEATINGMGTRVTASEQNFKRLEGQFSEHQRSVDRILGQNEHLIKELGKAERGTDQCREDTEKFTIEIGSKVDTMRRDVLQELRETREDFGARAGKLEVDIGKLTTEVQLRAEFGARGRDRE